MKNGVYTSLDIGTTSIKVIVSEVINNQMNVIGVGSERTDGISKGLIVDIDETAQSIKKAVNQAEEKAGISIDSLIIGVPAVNIEIEPFHVNVNVSSTNQEINDEVIHTMVKQIREKKVSSDQTLLSIMIEEFIIDGFDGIKDPRKMVGDQIECYGTVLTISKTVLHNIKKSINNAGYVIDDLLFQPKAMSELIMSEDERRFGTIQIDMGGGQTTVSAVHDQQVKFSKMIKEGGYNITKDISVVLNTSLKNAEKIKREVGYAFVDENDLNNSQSISIDVVGQDQKSQVKESYIAEIIEARAAQIFEQVKAELDEIGALELPGGVILTGGTSAIPLIEELAEDIFEVNVKKYVPDFMGVRYPSFTNGISLVYYKSSMDDLHEMMNHYALFNEKEPPKKMMKAQENGTSELSVQQYKDTQDKSETFMDKFKKFLKHFFD
ncbi:cell division protein FtsA [Alkalibacterium kapii]|uniref:Cell division protein FtsA n=1 Tax=Alkalibacterium kapii TaxID=426704 RepID=A0A511AV28_9LACT|nr:cell division protein FtsA [Alkalibacterium kapii]GEK91532.1 cell division protein FtsA [Alkalibacterium kapii]